MTRVQVKGYNFTQTPRTWCLSPISPRGTGTKADGVVKNGQPGTIASVSGTPCAARPFAILTAEQRPWELPRHPGSMAGTRDTFPPGWWTITLRELKDPIC